MERDSEKSIYVPQSTVELLERLPLKERHPGLQLDKFSLIGDQKAQQNALNEVVKICGDQSLLTELFNRRASLLKALQAVTWSCQTTGPFTLHLSRASAMENAGICLHPLYGFVYLPGSGIKGMARAFAEKIWGPSQHDEEGKEKILAVFGNSPGEPKQELQHAGAIVFHDAWPETWPRLFVDIVNNHHFDYYGANPDDNQKAPGDWEDPKPVYFLAVEPGQKFSFALSKRRADVPDEFVNLAREWLMGALCHEGAGAKTAAGYGNFKPADETEDTSRITEAVATVWELAKNNNTRAEFEATLELVTPAFLAGASQNEKDCNLRPATLRGLLRWWWRTMHAGYVDVKTLRELEASVWGNTEAGGAVRITVKRASEWKPEKYDKYSKARMNDVQKKSNYGIPSCNPRETTQGLWYISYGMDELVKVPNSKERMRRQRYFAPPGAKWTVRLTARKSQYPVNDRKSNGKKYNLTAHEILEQAKAALWLLCHFGGVGSKARKGFGSLCACGFDGWTKDDCVKVAEDFRKVLGLSNSSIKTKALSSSLTQMLNPIEVIFKKWTDPWQVLDQVGFAYQAFAMNYKHQKDKMALGLPRHIGQPVTGNFKFSPPIENRHSSPVHIHIARHKDGLLVRVVAFPAAYLPDLDTSRTFLSKFCKNFEENLQKRANLDPSHLNPRHNPGGQYIPQTVKPNLPKTGDRVEAVLLAEKTKNGRWKAKHEPSGLIGPIQNTNDVPADQKLGNRVTLIVASVGAGSKGEIQFKWPTAKDEKPKKK